MRLRESRSFNLKMGDYHVVLIGRQITIAVRTLHSHGVAWASDRFICSLKVSMFKVALKFSFHSA